MKKAILFLSLFPLAASAFNNASFEGKMAIDGRVISEMRKFDNDGQRLPDDYINKFAASMKRRLIQDKRNYLARIEGKPCQPSSTVTFLKAGEAIGRTSYGAAEQDAIDEFESGIVKIEATGCLNGAVAAEAMTESRKPTFQMSVVSELKSSSIQGSLTCDRTSVPFLGTSSYCFTSIASNTANESYLFTQNVTNAPIAQASAPVFYRSIYMSFHEQGNQTYSHTVAYVRGPKIPGLGKGMARSKIQSTQTKSYERLGQIVRAK